MKEQRRKKKGCVWEEDKFALLPLAEENPYSPMALNQYLPWQ